MRYTDHYSQGKEHVDNEYQGDKLRVAFLITGNPQEQTGGYIYDRALMSYLEYGMQRGRFNVRTITTKLKKRWLDFLSNFRVFFLLSLKDGRNFDIIIQDGMLYRQVVFANLLARIVRRPNPKFVGLIHMVDWPICKNPISRRLAKMIEAKWLNGLDIVIANSQDTISKLLKLENKVDDNRIFLVPPGHGSLDFRPNYAKTRLSFKGVNTPSKRREDDERSKSSRIVHLLYVGQVIDRKGLHLLIVALSKLFRSDWELTVVGNCEVDRKYFQRILRLIKKFKFENKITFTGEIRKDRVTQHMYGSDIFISPSLYEAYGMAILEAQCSGLPVVAFDVGGVSEIVRNGVTGCLVPISDVSTLAQAISQLIEKEDLRSVMSSQSLKRTGQFLTWEQTCSRIASILYQSRSLNEA